MSAPPLAEGQEALEERVERLFRELRLAIRFDRPSILLAVYVSGYVQAEASAQLDASLRELGQSVTHVIINQDNSDLPQFLAQQPDRAQTVFFVYNLQWGREQEWQQTYRALNIRREYFVEQCLRVVFWLTEKEAIALPQYAPDFWAFRHRVVEFVEPPRPDQIVPVARALAWSGFEERTLREDTEAKIALREALLADLPPGEETLAARAELLFMLAVLYGAERAYERSVDLFRRALQLAEQWGNLRLQAGCYNGMGNVYFELGRYEEAIATFQQAIALDPLGHPPYRNLGRVYRTLGRNTEAIAAYRQAIVLDPEDTDSFNGLGNVYGDLGRYEEAITAYQKAIALDPQFAYPHNGLGNVYQDLGRYAEAIAAFQEAIALDPQSAYYHYNLGRVYYKLGRYEEAITAYQGAIALDLRDANSHIGLGNGHTALAQYEEAIVAFQQAIAIDPKNAYAHNNLGNVYNKLGHYEEAIVSYEQAIALDPQYAYSHNNLGSIYAQLGRYAEAIAAFEQAIALDPQYASPYKNLGNVYYQIGHYEEAIAAYQQAITLEPKWADDLTPLINEMTALLPAAGTGEG
ncbi:MAG: tetratricopeptide repeat protein [Chloroflexota bacterium]